MSDQTDYKAQFPFMLREHAANVLRIVRGAGRPGDVVGDAEGLYFVSTQIARHQATDMVANDMRLKNAWSEMRDGKHKEEDIDRWREDGTFDEMQAVDTILRGALQIVASRLLGQRTQESTGESELYRGINELAAARAKIRKLAGV